MPKKTGKFVAALCVLLPALAFTAGDLVLTGTEWQVTTAAADQFDPAISGRLVVYTDFSGVDADVWYTDIATGTAHPVSIASGDQQLTGVSGNRIVYTDWNSMDVYVFDVTTATATNLTEAAWSNALDPAIDGDLVAWTDDRHGNAEIYARYLVTGEERRITNSVLVDQSPAVGDGIIVYERCEGFGCDVFAYNWATNATVQLTTTLYATERFPDVAGRFVVFQREEGTPIDKDLVAYNLDTGIETELALPGDQENPHISGDFVAFNDSSSGIPHIGLWQLSTGARFAVTAGTAGQYLNDIDGTRIVYSDNRAGTLDIWAYDFKIEAVPPDPPEDPDVETQLQGLADMVAALNLKAGIVNSLDAKLNAALSALEAARKNAVGTACNQLGAFINEVDAQSGKAISQADAAMLKTAATNIRAALGCS